MGSVIRHAYIVVNTLGVYFRKNMRQVIRRVVKHNVNILEVGMKNHRKRQLLAALRFLSEGQIPADFLNQTTEALEARRAVLAMLLETSEGQSAQALVGRTARPH